MCMCVAGYSGLYCQTQIDQCASMPCVNNGSCVDNVDSFTCICPPGYSGTVCETQIDTCASAPCANGGTCTDLVNGYTCACPSGYSGTTCQVFLYSSIPLAASTHSSYLVCHYVQKTDVDECASVPCMNGGSCVDGIDSYSCVCAAGYSGILCQTDIDECASQPCINGGTCVDDINGFDCICPIGFAGTICDQFTCQQNILMSCDVGIANPTMYLVDPLNGHLLSLGSASGMNGCNAMAQDPTTEAVLIDGSNGMYSLNSLYTGMLDQPLNITPTFLGPISGGLVYQAWNFRPNDTTLYGIEAVTNNPLDVIALSPLPPTAATQCPVTRGGAFSFMPDARTIFSGNGNSDTLTYIEYHLWTDQCADAAFGYWGGVPGDCAGAYLSAITALQTNGLAYGWLQCQRFYGGNPYVQLVLVDPVNVLLTPLGPRIPNPTIAALTTANLTLCLNQGYCSNGDQCICLPGYSGSICQTQIDECASAPCQNEATCTDQLNGYTCVCLAGFSGMYCQTQINTCASTPCMNQATCIDQIDSWVCQCLPGFSGVICQTQVDLCASNPCVHGGTCVDRVNGYTCQCLAGYSGNDCQTQIDECASQPCHLGTCVDHLNGYTCNCPPGTSGLYCQTDVDECASMPCQNSGTCTDGLDSFTCLCMIGYSGILCQTQINQCASTPCKNSGTCTNLVDSYICTCVAGYSGPQCQTLLDSCASSPCENGGICVDHVNGFVCQCPAGYSGAQCQTRIDDCASTPCQHGGTCAGFVNGFSCTCPPEYGGRICEEITLQCSPIPCSEALPCTNPLYGYAICRRPE